MFINTGFIVVVIVHIQIVQSQNDVAFRVETQEPYQCDKKMEIKCTYTGTASQCCNLTRVWRVNRSPVMTDGNLAIGVKAGKYEEGEVNHNGKYFTLIINDLENADLGNIYSCTYDFDDLHSAVHIGSKCRCRWCIGRSVLYGGVGLVIGILILGLFKIKGGSCKCRLTENNFFRKCVTVAITSTVTTIIVSALIGNYLCPCLRTEEPSFILIGLVFGCTLLVILLAAFSLTDPGEDDHLCTQIALAVITYGIWLLVEYIYNKCFTNRDYIETMKVMFGSDVQLKSPYKKDASGQITWIKLNGNIREIYLEGTAINQDLAKNLRDRLKVDGRNLSISNVQDSDAGIYECVFTPKPNKVPQGSRVKLIVSAGKEKKPTPV